MELEYATDNLVSPCADSSTLTLVMVESIIPVQMWESFAGSSFLGEPGRYLRFAGPNTARIRQKEHHIAPRLFLPGNYVAW
jgi:hypothetical protein